MIKDVTAVEDERGLLHRVKNTLEIERLELPKCVPCVSRERDP